MIDFKRRRAMNQAKGDYSRWENLYRSQDVEEMPWFYPRIDPDLEMALSLMDIHSGSFLDLCTGPGTQALALAERGFCVTASDIADTAVHKAYDRARQHGLDISFRQNDLFDSRLGQSFNYIFDRGCYHIFPRQMRAQYPAAVASLLKPAGCLFLKCFSHLEERQEGPYHIDPDEIREFFDPLFKEISITDTVFQGTAELRRRGEPKALFCVLRRRAV